HPRTGKPACCQCRWRKRRRSHSDPPSRSGRKIGPSWPRSSSPSERPERPVTVSGNCTKAGYEPSTSESDQRPAIPERGLREAACGPSKLTGSARQERRNSSNASNELSGWMILGDQTILILINVV